MTAQTQLEGIGFIGAGRMATALARGLIAARFVDATRVVASDVSPEAAERFASTTGGRFSASNGAVIDDSTVIVLAVKPQQVSEVLTEQRPQITDEHLLVSIAAGVTLQSLREAAGDRGRLVRVMPNTPCLVGAGASAFACDSSASREDAALVQQMLGTVGWAVEVPESQLDAVTGLSGSGPAYVFQIIEALSDGGVRVGLPRETAMRLAAQTVLGAAKMVLETGEHPGALKDAVASPGGTTIAGLHALEHGGLRSALIDAVVAATLRSVELGRSCESL